MTAPAHPRLPGITFETAPPLPADPLPRMDVAAFVGFAAAGPVNIPVAVEDIGGFRGVFGPDLPLARDARTGELRHAHLGAAVEEFFRNGGRRCQVVRVAGETAVHSVFPLHGLVAVDRTSGSWSLGTARSRAVGGWADGLGVTTALAATRLPPVTAFDPARSCVRLATDAPLAPGDLLRLAFGGGRTVVLVTVAATTRTREGLDVRWAAALVQRRAVEASVPCAAVRAARVDPGGPVDLAHPPQLVGDPRDPDAIVLEFPGAVAAGAGDLLRVEMDDGAVLAVPLVERVGPGPYAFRAHPAHAVASHPLPDVAADGLPAAERLDLTLDVWAGERHEARLGRLSFAPAHPRFWADLPTDDEVFGGPPDSRRELATVARFPLAGPQRDRPPGTGRSPLVGPQRQRYPEVDWFPLGMAEVANSAAARGPLTDTAPATRLHREGLHAFDAALFVDADLAGERSPAGLLDRAHAKAYLQEPTAPLAGVHALLPVEEVTLLAVPDSTHPGWAPADLPRPDGLGAPELAPPGLGGPAQVRLTWTAVPGADGYVLQQSREPSFVAARIRLDGPPPGGGATPEVLLDGFGTCPVELLFRVRATARGGRSGPWSNTVSAVVPGADFRSCATSLRMPELRWTGDTTLAWTPDTGLSVELESAPDPLFELRTDPPTFHEGGVATVEVPRDVDVHLRARFREGERFGPWSNTLLHRAPPQRSAWMLEPEAGEVAAALVEVQRAVLRLAVARGDLLAVLALPAHYRESECLAHLSELTGPAEPLDGALTHGTLVHPWTLIRTGDGVRAVPPDGALTGVIARRTLDRGAWISPANQPVLGIAALAPGLDDVTASRLLAAGVTVLAQRPHGTVPLTVHTLGVDPALRPVEVRRLLVLLRRLALRHGTTYVFEPHGHRFRSMVQRTFEGVLADLFTRGALAGATPAEAFRVVADDSVNPPAAVDAGRFAVELQVAPTRPLTFLRVRLVQSGPGNVRAVEV